VKDFGELNVLIVEPDTDSRVRIESVFKEVGLNDVQSESDFKKAGQRLADEEFHIVVISDYFAGTTAPKIITFLKLHCPDREIPFILKTKSEDSEFVRSLIIAGASVLMDPLAEIEDAKKALESCLRSVKLPNLKALIRESEFFSEFSEEECEAMYAVSAPRRFEAGEEIITKGDPADNFFVLLQGKVMVIIFRQDHTIIDIPVGAGSPFGEMAILDNCTRSAWCVAANDCIVLEVGKHIFSDTSYVLRQKVFAKLAIIMADRIRKMNQLIDEKVREGLEQIAGNLDEVHVQRHVEVPKAGSPEEKELEKTEKIEVDKEPEVARKRDPKEEPIPQKPKEPEVAGGSLTEEEQAAAKVERQKRRADERRKLFDRGGEREQRQRDLKLDINPYIVPVGIADSYLEDFRSQEEYDVLLRKVNLRTDFIVNKIPNALSDMVCNKFFGYWTGSKLASINPHDIWSTDLFTPGSPQLKKALHLVVVASEGDAAYKEAYLSLPLSHRIVGLTDVGCSGTFLGNYEAIKRYLNDQCLKSVIKLDMEIPIDRIWKEKDVIEFLTHTTEDVRQETLFLVFDDQQGKHTKLVRDKFPRHQIVTVVKDIGFNFEAPSSMFTETEKRLVGEGLIVDKKKYKGLGFYQGQTVFLADFSTFFSMVDSMKASGYIFATIGALARMGPDYSGVVWGSKGGADGAVKAARAMFGVKGAQDPTDIAAAVNWADGDSGPV
jgi:CRP-like cAMP-binding protein